MGRDLPFVPNRVFVINDVPPLQKRGFHAHRECHQLLICVSGSLRVSVNDGSTAHDFYLDSPSHALYLPPMTWGEQSEYSKGAILLVLASHPYDAQDYISDFEMFRLEVTKIPR